MLCLILHHCNIVYNIPYKSHLTAAGLNVIIPDDADREFINTAIYGDLMKGIVKPETNAEFIKIISKLQSAGAKGVILGCTELTLLDLEHVELPLFDTVKIHVDTALKFAVS